jgi:hypothetical protein
MGLVIVPQDYENLARDLAPIYIEDQDKSGEPINLEWVDLGVRPIHSELCHLTKRIVGDLWAVSEVAGNAVHGIWRDRGNDLGSDPWRQVQARAVWEAKDIRAGGWRFRKGCDKHLDDLDDRIRAAVTHDPRDYKRVYDMHLDIEALTRDEDEMLKRMIGLHLRGWTWQEIGTALEQKPNTLRQKFLRWKHRIQNRNGSR